MRQAWLAVARREQSLRAHGPLLVLARGAWIVTTIGALALLITSVPLRYDQLLHNTGSGAVEPAVHAATLHTLGFSPAGYAAYMLLLELLLAAGFLVAGMVIVWRKSDEWPPLLFSHLLIMTGIAASELSSALQAAHPGLRLIVEHLRTYGLLGLLLFGFLFPDGRFVPRWTWLPALIWLAVNTASIVAPGSRWDVETWPRVLDRALLMITVGSLPVATIYRYRRVSDAVQRQQTKWVMFTISIAVMINLGLALLGTFIPAFASAAAAGIYFRFISDHVTVLVFLLIPLAVADRARPQECRDRAAVCVEQKNRAQSCVEHFKQAAGCGSCPSHHSGAGSRVGLIFDGGSTVRPIHGEPHVFHRPHRACSAPSAAFAHPHPSGLSARMASRTGHPARNTL